MKISEFITRLQELKGIAGDIEVVVKGGPVDYYDYATMEIVNVVEHDDGGWLSLGGCNTLQILVVW